MLHGPVPSFISQLTSLQDLWLSSNNLEGALNVEMFSKLQRLTTLDLSHNMLYVESNCSSSSVPCNSSFHNLKTLILGSCKLQNIPYFLRNAEKLEFMDLSNNQMSGQIPNWLWKKKLTYVDLSNNSLTSLELPLPDAASSELRHVDLHFNSLRGPIPIFSRLAAFLDYSSNEFTSGIPVDICSNLSKLTFFRVSGNNFVGQIPSSICTATGLTHLDLSYNQLSGTIPSCIGDFSRSLSVLNLKGNYFHGTMPQSYSSNLRSLGLNGNRLEGEVATSLGNCKLLEVLDLGNNQLSGTFPFWLEKMPNLQVLILSSNRFHGLIRSSSAGDAFTMLHVIDISSNSFTGNLPSEYFLRWKAMTKFEKSQGKFMGSDYYYDSVTVVSKGLKMELLHILDTFIAIDLSNNKFQGVLPDSLGELKALIVLNLSGNSLSGQIAASLEKLKELESFDLSQNKFSGKIPWQLMSLTFLSVLNLARNQLVGRIPRGGQFATFSNTSYNGNLDLCGFPLSKNCVDSDAAAPAEFTPRAKLDVDSVYWMFVLAGYGCGVVTGGAFAYVLLWTNHVYFPAATF